MLPEETAGLNRPFRQNVASLAACPSHLSQERVLLPMLYCAWLPGPRAPGFHGGGAGAACTLGQSRGAPGLERLRDPPHLPAHLPCPEMKGSLGGSQPLATALPGLRHGLELPPRLCCSQATDVCSAALLPRASLWCSPGAERSDPLGSGRQHTACPAFHRCQGRAQGSPFFPGSTHSRLVTCSLCISSSSF